MEKACIFTFSFSFFLSPFLSCKHAFRSYQFTRRKRWKGKGMVVSFVTFFFQEPEKKSLPQILASDPRHGKLDVHRCTCKLIIRSKWCWIEEELRYPRKDAAIAIANLLQMAAVTLLEVLRFDAAAQTDLMTAAFSFEFRLQKHCCWRRFSTRFSSLFWVASEIRPILTWVGLRSKYLHHVVWHAKTTCHILIRHFVVTLDASFFSLTYYSVNRYINLL